jgi:hypothetical protein
MQDNAAPFRLAARAAVFAIGFAATAPALAETIRCESRDNREAYCGANTSRGVELVQQLSSRGCYQGQTWGYDRRGIWVNGGCRAVFETNYWGNNNNNWNNNNNNWNNNNNNWNNNNHNNNNNNSGTTAIIALGAILGAAAIASAASGKGKSDSSGYQTNYNKGCDYGRKDRSAGKSRDYYSHSSAYSSDTEQAFAAGYNKCWNSN